VPGESFVGVDVGGGGIRVRALLRDVLVKARCRGAVARREGRIDVAALGHRLERLLDDEPGFRDRPHIRRLAIGLTGMPELLDPHSLAREIHDRIPCDSVVIASDALTTHIGALGGRAGTIVAAGTGVIACATDHASVWVRAGGWGHLIGDEGGGSWIGAEAVRAALRQSDGRPGGSAALLTHLEERFGDPEGAVAQIYGSPSPVHELAAFAPLAASAARAGDQVAASIWQRAGEQLGEVACAAGHGLPPHFSWGGKLFDVGELLLDPLRAAIMRTMPDAVLTVPEGQAAEGALRLATTGLGRSAIALVPDAREYSFAQTAARS